MTIPTLKQVRNDLMDRALEAHDGNVIAAAKAMGVSKTAFYRWLQERACVPKKGSA